MAFRNLIILIFPAISLLESSLEYKKRLFPFGPIIQLSRTCTSLITATQNNSSKTAFSNSTTIYSSHSSKYEHVLGVIKPFLDEQFFSTGQTPQGIWTRPVVGRAEAIARYRKDPSVCAILSACPS